MTKVIAAEDRSASVDKNGKVLFVSSDNEYASKIASCWSKTGDTGVYNTNDEGEITGWKCD